MHFTEEKIANDIHKISTHRDKNERLSWKRKKDKIEALVKELEPIEDEILKLIEDKKAPIYNQIVALRGEMIKECVHPKDSLVHYGNYVVCKFCDAKLTVSSNRTL